MAYEELFKKIGAEYGLDWRLLAHQAWQESRFNPLAVGAANDMGLMQIVPATWDEWAPKVGVFDPFDPESNIRVAAALLAHLRATLTRLGRPEPYWWLTAVVAEQRHLERCAAGTTGLRHQHHPGGRSGRPGRAARPVHPTGVRITS